MFKDACVGKSIKGYAVIDVGKTYAYPVGDCCVCSAVPLNSKAEKKQFFYTNKDHIEYAVLHKDYLTALEEANKLTEMLGREFKVVQVVQEVHFLECDKK